MRVPILTPEEKELLTRAANLMEELLETIQVMQDEELVEVLKIAPKEVEEGKTRPLHELSRSSALKADPKAPLIFGFYLSHIVELGLDLCLCVSL